MNREKKLSAESEDGGDSRASERHSMENRVERSNPFIWVSWLSKLMAGEKQCEWACWFRSHYVWKKVPSGLDLAKWTADHQQLLRARKADLEAEGFTVYAEDQNSGSSGSCVLLG